MIENSGARAETGATVERKTNTKNGYWRSEWKKVKKHRRILWFILPAAFFTIFFSYIPMLGVLYAFKDSNGFMMNMSRYGVLGCLTRGGWTFENFADIFTDESIWLAVGNTLFINVAKLIICFPLSILIAVQLADLKNQGFSKTILIIICIPNFLSWSIVISIWNGILNPDIGFLGQIIAGGKVLLTEDSLFKGFVVFFSAWKSAGWGCIMYYAAIMAIDKSFYESADLEGANKLQKMWYLTLPSILPTVALMLVLNFSGMLSAGLEQVYTMLQLGSELPETQLTLDTYIYDISFVRKSNIPFATALSVFNGLIALALMIIGNKITSKTLHRGLW